MEERVLDVQATDAGAFILASCALRSSTISGGKLHQTGKFLERVINVVRSWTGGANLRSVQLDPGVHPALWEGHRPIPLVVPVHVPPKDDVPLGGQLPQSCASLQGRVVRD